MMDRSFLKLYFQGARDSMEIMIVVLKNHFEE